MKTVFIYTLNDPLTGEIRYVGKTGNLKDRLSQHLSEAKNRSNRRTCWIKSLLSRGLRPTIRIEDEVDEPLWPMLEVAYVSFFKEIGCTLVNGNDGGEGGANPTDETRLKISRGKKGKVTANLGKKQSPEHREANRLGHLGKKLSEEHKKNIGLAQVGMKRSPGTGEKIRAALLGKPHSDERRANISAARKLWWAKKKGNL